MAALSIGTIGAIGSANGIIGSTNGIIGAIILPLVCSWYQWRYQWYQQFNQWCERFTTRTIGTTGCQKGADLI